MIQDVVWQARHIPGMEHLRVQFDAPRLNADGLVIGLDESRPFRIQYRIVTDDEGCVREVEVRDLLGLLPSIQLRADGQGHWTDADETPLPDLDGCIDVDISVTPFTNTLPVRRLRLYAGETRSVKMIYVQALDMQVTTAEQSYTCLTASADESRYLYEQRDFRAEILFDATGLVKEYAGLFSRVWTQKE